jgi:hypothetical protein
MKRSYPVQLAFGLITALLLVVNAANAQWSAEPGATVRNVFGPDLGGRANQCRGACGGGCPSSCEREVSFECMGESRLRRVETFKCGTHEGCREHDDCLDACLQNNPQSGDCQSQCDRKAMENFGLESVAWLTGGGSHDGNIRFEYTRVAPAALEPAYRCPADTKRQCKDTVTCRATDGTAVAPVFDAYPAAQAGAMQISGLLAGPVCEGDGERVCEQSADIRITGADSCPGGRCTRFGMEFDYRNADPAVPLECSVATRGAGGDFVGDLLKLGGDAMSTRGGDPGKKQDDGMAQLLGMFGKVLASADSPEDINISMTPLDENGKPIESQRVGSEPRDGPGPVPRTVDLSAASGHLFVPMYQLADNMQPGKVKERRVSCTHKDHPVLETVFRLQ